MSRTSSNSETASRPIPRIVHGPLLRVRPRSFVCPPLWFLSRSVLQPIVPQNASASVRMTASDPETPVSDTESIMVLDSDNDQDIEPSEQTLTREPPSSLAARFRNLCQTSPSPPPESLSVPVPPPSPQKTLSRPAGYRPIVSRTPVANNMPRVRVRASQVRSCDQCRTSKQKVSCPPHVRDLIHVKLIHRHRRRAV